MTDRRLTATLALVAVATVAIALRAGPLHLSPLPFNPDGIIHARHAAQALGDGQLPLATLATDDLFFTAYLVALADVIAMPPRYIAQPSIAVVGAVPCVLAVAFARRIGRDLGWRPNRATFAGLLAGGLLAVDGLYLHRSMPTDEQTLGLLFAPLVVVAAARAITEHSWRWALVAAIPLVVLPATHNLDTMVVALALTAGAGLAISRGRWDEITGSAGFAIGGWVLLGGYSVLVAWLTPAEITQSGRITGVPGLFLAWIVLLVLGLTWIVHRSARTQRALGLSLFAGMFGLLSLNAITPIFPGMQSTPVVLAAGILPLVLVAMVGAWGVPDGLASPTGLALATLFAGGVALVGFALTASLTPEYLNLVYRAQTFLHLPATVFVGIGAVAVFARRGTITNQRVVATVSVLLLVAAAASIPIAFSGLSLLPYKGTTTPAEYTASGFAAERVPGEWAADNHIARLTWDIEDVETAPGAKATTAPVASWTRGGPPPACPTVIQHSWTTVGAQLFPVPPATVDGAALEQFWQDNHVVYATGTPDPVRLVVPRNATHPSCGP